MGRTLTTNQTFYVSQGLKHQSMSTHEETHDSGCICSRGWHSLASVGGEAFDPVKAHFPSVEEHQVAEVREGGWEREHLHGGNGWGNESGGRAITSEM